jgi:hypothetical protein
MSDTRDPRVEAAARAFWESNLYADERVATESEKVEL